MPWHPPCALSNLIVTNLSSCQRIDFSIFVSFFLLRPTAKLFAFLRSCVLLNTFATGFFTRCFPSGCAVFKVHSVLGFIRSLKTIQCQEVNSHSTTPLFASWIFRLFGFQHFRAPQTHFRVSVSTWNELPDFSRAGSVARPARPCSGLPRKEVIQPHLPVRLPCYDFTPITNHNLEPRRPRCFCCN